MITTLDGDLTVTTFAAVVRDELYDLGDEVVDELTDGLEADLADKLADGDELGDPTAYAAELRAAAGLGMRGRRTRRGAPLAELRAGLVAVGVGVRAALDRHPRAASVFAFFTALRPLWWVLRAWVIFGVLTMPWMWAGLPSTGIGWTLLVALVVVSVQWGRGRWLPWRWSRGFVVVASVFAVLAAPYLLGTAVSQASQQINPDDFVSEGVLLNREQVTNIFAYGPDGAPLDGIQLFDQNGNPLSLVPKSWGSSVLWDATLGDSRVLVPADGQSWNVFPLKSVATEDLDPDTGEVPSWATRTSVARPFASAQQLPTFGGSTPGSSTTPVP